MNTKRALKTIAISLTTAAVLFYGLAYYVYAYHGAHGSMMYGHLSEGMAEWLSEELSLTKEQKEQLNTSRKALYDKVMEIHDSGIALKQEMMAQLENREFTRENVSGSLEAYKGKLGELTEAVVVNFENFYNNLDEGQKVTFKELVTNFSKWHCPHTAPSAESA